MAASLSGKASYVFLGMSMSSQRRQRRPLCPYLLRSHDAGIFLLRCPVPSHAPSCPLNLAKLNCGLGNAQGCKAILQLPAKGVPVQLSLGWRTQLFFAMANKPPLWYFVWSTVKAFVPWPPAKFIVLPESYLRTHFPSLVASLFLRRAACVQINRMATSPLHILLHRLI